MITVHDRMVIEKWRRTSPTILLVRKLKRGKNDRVDAEAICEAVTRPMMRFVPVKSAEQQSILMLHRTRDLFVRHEIVVSGIPMPARAISVQSSMPLRPTTRPSGSIKTFCRRSLPAKQNANGNARGFVHNGAPVRIKVRSPMLLKLRSNSRHSEETLRHFAVRS